MGALGAQREAKAPIDRVAVAGLPFAVNLACGGFGGGAR